MRWGWLAALSRNGHRTGRCVAELRMAEPHGNPPDAGNPDSGGSAPKLGRIAPASSRIVN